MNKFRKFIFSVPYGEYETIKMEIIEQCFINNSIFFNWNSGRTEIPQLAIPVIKDIAKKHGLKCKL